MRPLELAEWLAEVFVRTLGLAFDAEVFPADPVPENRHAGCSVAL
jgi:hypothetical protein